MRQLNLRYPVVQSGFNLLLLWVTIGTCTPTPTRFHNIKLCRWNKLAPRKHSIRESLKSGCLVLFCAGSSSSLNSSQGKMIENSWRPIKGGTSSHLHKDKFTIVFFVPGMGVSSFAIVFMKLRLEWHSIIFTSLGGTIGVIFGKKIGIDNFFKIPILCLLFLFRTKLHSWAFIFIGKRVILPLLEGPV